MQIRQILTLIRLVSETAPYETLIQFLFNEEPPPDHNFLARTNLDCISDEVNSLAKDIAFQTATEYTGRELVDASVAFLLHSPFDFYCYRDIWQNLPKSEFTLDVPWIIENVLAPKYFLGKLIAFLEGNGAPFRLLTQQSNARDFFNKYDAVIASGKNRHITSGAIRGRKIHLMYTQSKDAYTFGLWLRYFDAVLTFGDYAHERVTPLTKSIPVGNPRFDRWFGDREMIQPFVTEKRRDSNKKTMLYLPTHGNLSSLSYIRPQIEELLRHYNIIIRPHQYMLRFAGAKKTLERFRLELGESIKEIEWADDFTDALELFAAADFVVSDNSGTIFDAVLLDKPVVLIDPLSPSFFKKDMWEVNQYAHDVWTIPGSYPGSIEQRIKRETEMQPGAVANSTHSLKNAITETLQNGAYAKNRAMLRAMLFAETDGHAGKRAATAIKAVAQESSRPWNLLDYAAEEAAFGENALLRKNSQNTLHTAGHYVNLGMLTESSFYNTETLEFSIIVPTLNGASRIEETLQSLLRQTDVNDHAYEIIVVDDGSKQTSKKVIQKLIQEFPTKKIRYVSYEKNKGAAFARNIGIKLAEGTYVCFTDDDCIVPPDWLARFRRDFEEHPEIAGSGGWYRPPAAGRTLVPLLNRAVFWEPLPYILTAVKTAMFFSNYAGNTANVCYRKKILERIGGFNYYFVFASVEDWEIKVRLHKAGYPLLFVPRLIEHKKGGGSLGDYVRFCLIRGWSGFLLFVIHRDYEHYHRTISSSIVQFLQAEGRYKQIRAKGYISAYPELGYSRWFHVLNALRFFLLWVGKFGIVLWERLGNLER